MGTTNIMDEWIKRSPSTSESLSAHCRTHLSEKSHVDGIMKSKGSDRSRKGGPIEDTKMLLGG